MVKKKEDNPMSFLFEILFAVVNLFIVIFFYKNIFIASILLLIATVIGLMKWNSCRTLFIFLAAGIGGPFLEMLAISKGVWQYTLPNVYNIPFWLVLLWGNAGATIYQVARRLKERKIRK